MSLTGQERPFNSRRGYWTRETLPAGFGSFLLWIETGPHKGDPVAVHGLHVAPFLRRFCFAWLGKPVIDPPRAFRLGGFEQSVVKKLALLVSLARVCLALAGRCGGIQKHGAIGRVCEDVYVA